MSLGKAVQCICRLILLILFADANEEERREKRERRAQITIRSGMMHCCLLSSCAEISPLFIGPILPEFRSGNPVDFSVKFSAIESHPIAGGVRDDSDH